MENNLSTLKWSRGQTETVSQCPACGASKENAKIFERHDNDAYMPDLWHMARCGDCRSIWLDPRPDAKSLSHAYENYYYTHNAENSEAPQGGSMGLAWKLINGYLNHRFGMHRQPASRLGYIIFSLIEPLRLKLDYYGRNLTRNHVGTPGRLLDIGCGNGAFLPRAASMGWQVQGVEIDPKAVVTCKSIGQDVIEGDAFHPSLAEQSFDVITMSHVLEHIADQPALLQRTYDLLRPGGWLWLALPNPESLGLYACGSAWRGLAPPHHLSIPSQFILNKWLREKGFCSITFLRRGSHGPHLWRDSQSNAEREAISMPSASRLFVWRLVIDALATVSPRWADETVLLARKPE